MNGGTRMARVACGVVVAMLLCGLCAAQPQQGQAVPADMDNPSSVVEAYLSACDRGDVAGALALCADDDQLLDGLAQMLRENRPEGLAGTSSNR